MTRVHLEGMGVIGSILARCLAAGGVDFTWSDSDRQRSAWRACTGAVYPGGDERDEAGRATWLAWRREAAWAFECSSLHPWVFCTKKPPHGARAGYGELSHNLRRLDAISVHVNAQALVRAARLDFDELQRRPERGAQRIVTHGWSWRRTESVWGWTVPVELDLDEEFLASINGQQPALYMRRGRFVMAYAYPIPRSFGLHYAGSSLIVQREERGLSVAKHYERWHRNFLELAGGAVRKVTPVGPGEQGWRPRENEKAHPDRPLLAERGGVWYVRPHWNSGVRHAPLIAAAVLKAIDGAPVFHVKQESA